MKRISILITSLVLSHLPLAALGYNVNFAFIPGLSGCFFGNQVETNKTFLDGSRGFTNYFTMGGRISADIIFNSNMAVESGIEYKNVNLNFATKSGDEYSNGEVNLNYSLFQVPVMFKYYIPITKTTSVINSFNIAFGPAISVITPRQSYKDDLTTSFQSFINPRINAGLELDLNYTHVVGPGKILVGLKFDYSFIPLDYSISGRKVGVGNAFSFAPMIGYTFIIKEDKKLSKVTEKNKRIKDIAVE